MIGRKDRFNDLMAVKLVHCMQGDDPYQAPWQGRME
jgi:hypothetical protein